MNELKFRKLYAHEVDVRTQSVVYGNKKTKENPKGAILLLYKDARCDMNILDETVGVFNWKREHSRDNANCVVSLWDSSKGQWISKEDTGKESNQDAEKGLASDSFKRACVNWGIGRELYTSPFIWVGVDKVDSLEFAKYKCDEIGYNEIGDINLLVISDQKTGNVVYSFGKTKAKVQSDKTPPKTTKTTPKTAPKAEAPVEEVKTASQTPIGEQATAHQLEKIKQLYSNKDIDTMLGRLNKDFYSLTVEEASKMIEAKSK